MSWLVAVAVASGSGQWQWPVAVAVTVTVAVAERSIPNLSPPPRYFSVPRPTHRYHLLHDSEDLASAMAGGLAETLKGDFCWSVCFKPSFFCHLMREGFLPICCSLGDDLHVLLPKVRNT